MASPYQQQAFQRKLIYIGLILVLFTVAWGWRRYAVDAQARELAISEQSRGEVELSGALVRLGLPGPTGPDLVLRESNEASAAAVAAAREA